MAGYTYSNRDENRFWLEIMGDNALILHSRMAPGKREADEALYFFNVFEQLERRAAENPEGADLNELDRDAYNDVLRFRTFLLGILKSVVTQNFFVLIKPVYISNMATLAEEYLYLLGRFIEGKAPAHAPIVQDIFWLPILSSEARYIADNVGLYQRDLKRRAEDFSADLSYFFQYAVELQGIQRIGDQEFQILKQYRQDLFKKLVELMQFVQEVIGIYQQNGLPGTVSLLELDSFYRKLCYYTNQIAVAADLTKPACNAYSVRLSTL